MRIHSSGGEPHFLASSLATPKVATTPKIDQGGFNSVVATRAEARVDA